MISDAVSGPTPLSTRCASPPRSECRISAASFSRSLLEQRHLCIENLLTQIIRSLRPSFERRRPSCLQITLSRPQCASLALTRGRSSSGRPRMRLGDTARTPPNPIAQLTRRSRHAPTAHPIAQTTTAITTPVTMEEGALAGLWQRDER